jgi:hypothetical protein
MRLYHGTSSVNLEDIEANGLSAEEYVPGYDGVFLTNRREIAELFADVKVGSEGGDMVICDVDADPQALTADLVMWGMPSDTMLRRFGCGRDRFEDLGKAVDCWDEKVKRGVIREPEPQDWKLSLKIANSVISQKPIPPNKVRCRVI